MSRLTDPSLADESSPDRILPLVEEPGNRRRLESWIREQEGYRLVEGSLSLETAEFDLCVLDVQAFRKHRTELERRKRTAEPVTLPYLLLLPESADSSPRRDEGRLSNDGLWTTIDDVVTVPITQAELEWRVRSLLRLRRQSLDLYEHGQAMRENEKRLQAVIEASPDAIIVVDPTGRVEQWNSAAEAMFGWSREAVLGKPNPIIPDHKSTEFETWVGDILDGEAKSGLRTTRRTKSGELLDVRLSTAPVRDANDEPVGAMAIIEDVSDQIDRERDLRQFRQAIEATTHAVYITDTSGVIQYVNPAFETITGYAAEEAVGETPDLLSSGTRDASYYADLWETVLGGEPWHEEIINRRKDGEEYLADQTISPITDDDGAIEALVAIQQDITDRKRRDERFRAFIENSSDVITVIDEMGTVLYESPSIEQVLGYAPEELVGEPAFDIVHDDDVESVVSAFEELIEEAPGATVTVQYRARHKDGSWRWAESIATKRTDMLSGMFVINTRDVTERVDRQRELEEAQRTRSLALQAANAGIWEWDPATDEVTWHASCERLFGVEPGSFEGTYPAFAERVHPDDRSELETALEGIREGRETFQATFRIIRDDGVERWVDSRGETVSNGDGQETRVLGVLIDVTESQERIQQLRVLDRVLRHNLRNDMNVITGYAESVESDVEGAAAENLDRLRRQADSLMQTMEKGRLVTNVLAEESTAGEVRLDRLVGGVADRLTVDYPDAEIDVQVPDGATAVVGPNFDHAVEELIVNAIVHNDRSTPEVTVTASTVDDQIELAIADNGPGIPEMERSVVMGERSVEPLFHGSGLGLWLVSWIVRHSEGTLEFAENDPRGSIVTIRVKADGEKPGGAET